MKLSDKKGIQSIVFALAKCGLKEVVICPGSRNAPLTISFNRHPAFHCTSIRDERSAGFIALGKAIELKEPVAVLCTSGSASLNFAPAISEAYYQRIPLIVITADRPKEWTDEGDGQTINQTGLYHNFIRRSYDLNGDADSPSGYWYNRRCVSEGFNAATLSDRGPVHFNIPLHEPLYGTSGVGDSDERIFTEEKIEKKLSERSLENLSGQFSECKKVMILAGQHSVDASFRNELSKMAEFDNVVVLTESTSNIHNSYFIENIDRCITNMSDDIAKDFMPELLITVGGAVVSKRIKALLRKFQPRYHWNVSLFDSYMDTYQSLTNAVPLSASGFFSQLRQRIKNVLSEYRANWQKRKENMAVWHEAFCLNSEYSDLRAFFKIYQKIPTNICLHLANSSPVRYAQLFDNQNIAESWSNRGTSGIDGCVSTAVGAASASRQKEFLLITGDVAFHYDKNGLWNNEQVENLKIIVINNGGGGIFRIISGPDKVDEMKEYFETSLQTNVKILAQHFNWNYLSANDDPSLDAALKKFFSPDRKRTILEIFTHAEKNPEILEQYWKFLKEKSKSS